MTRDLAAGGEVDDADRVGAGVRDVEAGPGAVREERRRLLPDGDASHDPSRRQVHLDELAIALAAHEARPSPDDDDRPRELAPGPARRRQIDLRRAPAPGEVDHRERIVLVLRDDEARSRRRRRQTRRRRAPASTPRPPNACPSRCPSGIAGRTSLHRPSGPVRAISWTTSSGPPLTKKREPSGENASPPKLFGTPSDLHLARRAVRHVVDEDVLARRGLDALAVLVEHAVVTGREDQQASRRPARERSRRPRPRESDGATARCGSRPRSTRARRCVRRQRGAVGQAEDVGRRRGRPSARAPRERGAAGQPRPAARETPVVSRTPQATTASPAHATSAQPLIGRPP